MMKFIFALILTVAFGFSANAQTPVREGRDPGLKKQGEIELKERREDRRSDLKTEREMHKTELENKRNEFKDSLEERRTEAKEEFAAKRDELKEHLKRIKDERKKEIVERLNNHFHELNNRKLDHYSRILDKLDGVLERISARAERAHENGIDIQRVKDAISSAENKITDARNLILAQSKKTYPITVSTEDKLKTDISAVRQTLQADLKKIHDAVKTAHEAVREAAKILRQIHPEDKTATSTRE
jgi:uncharacterized protein YqgV (UPF0045/DUF77 family)